MGHRYVTVKSTLLDFGEQQLTEKPLLFEMCTS